MILGAAAEGQGGKKINLKNIQAGVLLRESPTMAFRQQCGSVYGGSQRRPEVT